ncbi:hypothetical protein COLO4_13136 [Corchorus olitorius]|uniref:Bet v I/Major latex protein domain-containing protein n=1 Tax=Corchorus olitorius TaxID=93759 RepID=A0A1R3JY02_9ROSI|nr:hypothetical protein COLO4_13136 [Corchorus olitorius]
MAQIAKMDAQIEMKSTADNVYDIFKNKLHLLPKISPQEFKGVKLVEGEWGSLGSVRVWANTASGSVGTAKETIEAIDDQSKTITYKFSEGKMMKFYKNFKLTLKVLPSGQGSLVKWTIDFEKQNESIPDPIKHMEFNINFTKNVDAYLLHN